MCGVSPASLSFCRTHSGSKIIEPAIDTAFMCTDFLFGGLSIKAPDVITRRQKIAQQLKKSGLQAMTRCFLQYACHAMTDAMQKVLRHAATEKVLEVLEEDWYALAPLVSIVPTLDWRTMSISWGIQAPTLLVPTSWSTRTPRV